MKSKLTKFLTIAFLLLVVWLVFLIVRPFLIAMLTSVLIAYLTYPLFVRVNRLVKKRTITAIIMSVLVILIITLPFFFLLNVVSKEARVSYIITKQKIMTSTIFSGDCEGKTDIICGILGPIMDFFSNPRTRYYVEDSVKKFTSYIIDNVSNLLFSIPLIVLNFFVMVFILFYLYKDGKILYERIVELIPLKRQHTKQILKRVNDVTYAVVYGQLFVAMIQGALGGFGFFIFGIPSPVLWGVAMALFALVPWLGPPIVWLPVALFQIMNGHTLGDNNLITKGILLILYGILIVGTIDNILRPKLIGHKGGIHPILALVGVIGGLMVFGFIGIFIGPIILAIFMTLIRIYETERSLWQ